MKYAIAVLVFLFAGGLFYFQFTNMDKAAPVENPFGEGSEIVGEIDGTKKEGAVSRAELSMHAVQANCWVAYKGVVYDITGWLPRHPGSAAAIAPYCGTAEEFTAAFGKQHGTSKEEKLKQEGTVEGALAE